MITQSGVHIQKIGGVEGTPTAMDIAVHAGRICRYGGAVWAPLLPHLIFVGLMAYKRSGAVSNLLWGFLHDAHEIATSDVPRPFKCDCMRKEQAVIDQRLFKKFFSGCNNDIYGILDLDLIKKCDVDACHIEAVQLGVPGFAEIEIAHATDYTGAKTIHADADDIELFQRIQKRSFAVDTIKGTDNVGVLLFAEALALAENRDYDGFMDAVIDWGLL